MRYRYDAAGRVESISHRQNAAQVSHYAYGYDQNGNRTRQEETNGRGWKSPPTITTISTA